MLEISIYSILVGFNKVSQLNKNIIKLWPLIFRLECEKPTYFKWVLLLLSTIFNKTATNVRPHTKKP